MLKPLRCSRRFVSKISTALWQVTLHSLQFKAFSSNIFGGIYIAFRLSLSLSLYLIHGLSTFLFPSWSWLYMDMDSNKFFYSRVLPSEGSRYKAMLVPPLFVFSCKDKSQKCFLFFGGGGKSSRLHFVFGCECNTTSSMSCLDHTIPVCLHSKKGFT